MKVATEYTLLLYIYIYIDAHTHDNCHSNSSSMLLYLSSATVCFHTCIIVWMPDRCTQHVQQIANDADLIYIAAFNCANKGPGANY